ETNISLLFCNYQNKSLEIARTKELFVESYIHKILSLSSILMLIVNLYSDIMINLFVSLLFDQIHQKLIPEQPVKLNINCELTFREAIKMAMKTSYKDAIVWLLEKLVNKKSLRKNMGYTILDCLRILSSSIIKSDYSKITHISNYLDCIMRGFFDDLN
ncbi:15900_t:CDS:1, partial [Funneliformis caledonium]